MRNMEDMTASKHFTTINPSCCSCRDWEYRGSRTGRPCKHIRRLQEALALLASNTARWAEREATD